MNQITIEDRALVEAIADIIEPAKELPKAHTGDRLRAMQARHLARSKATRILRLVRQGQ